MQPSWKSRHAARLELACFCEKTTQDVWIGVGQLVERDVSATTRHAAVVFPQGDQAFSCLRLHERIWRED